MARKAGIIATTIFLGKVDDGWIAWFVITSITFLAIALQLLMVPFPDEKNVKMSGILFECAPVREQQSRGLRKVYAMTATTCSTSSRCLSSSAQSTTRAGTAWFSTTWDPVPRQVCTRCS